MVSSGQHGLSPHPDREHDGSTSCRSGGSLARHSVLLVSAHTIKLERARATTCSRASGTGDEIVASTPREITLVALMACTPHTAAVETMSTNWGSEVSDAVNALLCAGVVCWCVPLCTDYFPLGMHTHVLLVDGVGVRTS